MIDFTSESKAKLTTVIRAMIDTPRTFYFGAIASRLPLVANPAIDSFAVSPDGELLFNPDYVMKPHDAAHRLFRDISHEVGHVALEHFVRREILGIDAAKEPHKAKMFNIAADCAIEGLLDIDFPDALGDPEHHKGLEQYIPKDEWTLHSTEGMYNTIMANHPDDGSNQGQGANGVQNIPELTEQGKQRLHASMQAAQKESKEQIIQNLIDQAATNTPYSAGQRQGNVSATNSLLGVDVQGQVFTSFDALKRLFHKSYGRGADKDDSTFNQRNMLRRDFEGLPLMGRHQRTENEKSGEIQEWHNDIDIYVDVSGSMDKSSIRSSLNFINTLAKKYGVTPLRTYTYNGDLVDEFVITASTNIDTLQIRTGGGTDINRVVRRRKPTGKVALILTDMEDNPIKQDEWEKSNPNTQLVWLIHANRNTNHGHWYGKKIYINDIINGKF